MPGEFSEFKDLFVQTSRENIQLLNNALLTLEKDPTDQTAIADIFRAAHSLKGECAAMEYTQTAYLCHTVEDVFAEIKDGRAAVTPELADAVFRCLDAIGKSIDTIDQQNTEAPDLGVVTDELKKLTGVQTVGIGKSVRPTPPTAPVPPPAANSPASAPANQPVRSAAKTVPVHIDQLDVMMGLIEELVMDRLVLKRLAEELKSKNLDEYYEKAGRTSDALQFQVMKLRAVPIKLVFDHFPRTVRDLARAVNKEIELVIEGQDLEVDRAIVERLDGPLTHLIRNAADHGLRASGTIRLSARREQDYVVIEVADNGDGIDWEALAAKGGVSTTDPSKLEALLFSGISTAEKVTEISGRGVGLGSVKKDIEGAGGWITVESERGKGTTFRVGMPLTLSVVQALVIRVDGQYYGIPAAVVDRSVKVNPSARKKIAGQEVLVLDGTDIPLLVLGQKFSPGKPTSDGQTSLAVIVLAGQERIALVVDGIVETSQLIVKPTPPILKNNRAFGGTTILGNGKSALLLNPQGLLS